MDPIRISPREIGAPLAPGGGLAPAGAPPAAPAEVPFQDLLKQAVDTANELGKKSDAMSQALVEGRAVDLHRVVLAQQESQIAFDLVLQMRDKLVSAYQEILRMPM